MSELTAIIRDGQIIAVTEDLLIWLHDHYPQSAAWTIKWYRLTYGPYDPERHGPAPGRDPAS